MESTFQPVREPAWRLGFRNLFAKENRKWWRANRWWMQALLWLGILGGFLVMILFVLPGLATPEGQPAFEQEPLTAAVQGFFSVGAIALAIGVTILLQDEIIVEKTSGTAEWVLSKPVSRGAFILAKLGAHSLGVLAVLVALPCLAAYGLFWFFAGAPYPLLPFLAGAGLLALHSLFYLSLVLMLGVLAERSGLVLAVSLGSILGGAFIRDFLPGPALLTPWFLPDVAGLAALGESLPPQLLVPPVATAVWTVIFLFVALWKFQRHEF